MVQKKSGLGRGLEALIRDTSISVPARPDEIKQDETANGNQIIYVPIDDIKPNSMQPRMSFDEEKIIGLADSIEKHGVLQPIMLRKAKRGYNLVAGERRWRAAKKAGLEEIPSIIRDLNEEENALFAIIENMQREDLNPIEEASAFRKIIDEYGMTQEAVATNVGESRPYVANTLRLLKLPQIIRDYIEEGKLSRGHANILGSVKDEKKQINIAKRIVKENLTVIEAKVLADNAEGKGDNSSKKENKKKESTVNNEEIRIVEDELTSIFGTKVSLLFKGESGEIQLHFYSKDELEGLLEDIRKNYNKEKK